MITQENKDIYRNISAKLAGYWELEREILDLGAVSDIEQSKVAQSRAMAELMPLYDDIYDQLASIMDVKVDRGNDISTVMTVDMSFPRSTFTSMMEASWSYMSSYRGINSAMALLCATLDCSISETAPRSSISLSSSQYPASLAEIFL